MCVWTQEGHAITRPLSVAARSRVSMVPTGRKSPWTLVGGCLASLKASRSEVCYSYKRVCRGTGSPEQPRFPLIIRNGLRAERRPRILSTDSRRTRGISSPSCPLPAGMAKRRKDAAASGFFPLNLRFLLSQLKADSAGPTRERLEATSTIEPVCVALTLF